MDIKNAIRSIPDWPIEGVIFRDITTLIQTPDAFRATCDAFYDRYKNVAIDKIVGIDARGFIFSSVLAYRLNVGLVPVRKKGKLPHETIEAAYQLEYGESVVEMHKDAIHAGEKVLIVDDLIATGGTVGAAAKLVEALGGDIVELAFVIELPDLHGRDKVGDYPIFALTEFEGE